MSYLLFCDECTYFTQHVKCSLPFARDQAFLCMVCESMRFADKEDEDGDFDDFDD